MRYWKFYYRCTKGRGAGACSYAGEVALGAPDLADAMRAFKLWALARPDGRYSITMTALHNLETVPECLEVAKEYEPPAELPEKEKEENEEIMKIKAPESVLPAEGEYLAKLVEYEDQGEQPNKFKEGEMIRRLQLVWQLKGGSKQFQWCNVTLHPQSKFYEILSALLGDNPPKEIDFPEYMDELVGKTAYVTVEHYKNNKGQLRSKVTDIRPAQFKGRTMPRPPEPSEPKVEEQEEFETEDVPF